MRGGPGSAPRWARARRSRSRSRSGAPSRSMRSRGFHGRRADFPRRDAAFGEVREGACDLRPGTSRGRIPALPRRGAGRARDRAPRAGARARRRCAAPRRRRAASPPPRSRARRRRCRARRGPRPGAMRSRRPKSAARSTGKSTGTSGPDAAPGAPGQGGDLAPAELGTPGADEEERGVTGLDPQGHGARPVRVPPHCGHDRRRQNGAPGRGMVVEANISAHHGNRLAGDRARRPMPRAAAAMPSTPATKPAKTTGSSGLP